MKITIETIPHDHQRYPTVGDWWFDPSSQGMPSELPNIQIRVSDMGNWRYEVLVAIHELVEVIKCRHDGITQQNVDIFDTDFEKKRASDNDDEPGDSPDAPYKKQHCLATGIERIMASELDVDWKTYDDAVMALP